MLSAGHCGDTAHWYLSGCNLCENHEGADLGLTSTIYYQDPDLDDFQAILTQPIGGSSARGYVYYSGSDAYYVEGVDIVAQGQPFSVDGSRTGQVRGVTALSSGGMCQWFDNHTVEDCHLIEGYDNTVVCEGGDSGGPSYVVDSSTGGAYAVGTVVGCSSSGGTYFAWAELIDQELSKSSTALLLAT